MRRATAHPVRVVPDATQPRQFMLNAPPDGACPLYVEQNILKLLDPTEEH